MTGDDWAAVEIIREGAGGDLVLVCEHAAHGIPVDLTGLGLSEATRLSHAAWDPGAMDVARALSEAFDAPLVAGRLSRLVYDCNRPPESLTAIRDVSEAHDVPGNRDLTDEQRADRARRVHDPFHAALERVLDTARPRALVTIHSFTPVYDGVRRAVELGFLHDVDDRLAVAALREARRAGRFASELNAPYAASDGVTYTLRRHAEARALPHVMIEIRNDLIADAAAAGEMADHLAGILRAALDGLETP